MKSLNHSTSTLFFAALVFFSGINSTIEANAQPEEKTLLWKIEGNGIKSSYLLGTFHLMPQSSFELKEKVKEAFETTEQLVLELDLDDPSLQANIMQYAAMKDGQTLDQLLTSDQYAVLDEAIKGVLGVGLQPFNTFKPLMIASFLTAKYIGEQPASFETALVQLALTQGIPVNGLETVVEQMSFFDNISYQKQADDLIEMIEQEEETQAGFEKMLALYKEEDHLALYRMMVEYIDDPNQLNALIHQRNENWVPMIKTKARDHSTFFAVGAGHLGGEKGVLMLLQKAGYTLTPIQ